MRLTPGNADPAKVPSLTGPELLAEAQRLACNCNLTGMEYTAAVLLRLCEELDRSQRPLIRARLDASQAMRRGEAL